MHADDQGNYTGVDAAGLGQKYRRLGEVGNLARVDRRNGRTLLRQRRCGERIDGKLKVEEDAQLPVAALQFQQRVLHSPGGKFCDSEHFRMVYFNIWYR